ncbi:hypothetical protein [Gracilimonas sp.]|uniref:hypothetical protein n=1 Tax=Gracilimonas sp. TaxID=1974203 RepID=UPI0032EB5BFB
MIKIIGSFFCVFLALINSFAQSPINTEREKAEPLFHLVNDIKINGTVDQSLVFDYGVLVVWRNRHSDHTYLSKFNNRGDLNWERKFPVKNNLRASVSKSSNTIILSIPIPWEDEYNTALRKCDYKVLNRNGELLNEFKLDCAVVTPIGDKGWVLLQYEQYSKTIYNYQKSEFFEEKDHLTNITVLSDNTLIIFEKIWEKVSQADVSNEKKGDYTPVNKQRNRIRAKLDSVLLSTLTISGGDIKSNKNALRSQEKIDYGFGFDSQQVEFESLSNTIGWSTRFLTQVEPTRKYESKLFFLNQNGELKSTFSSNSAIENFSFVNSSTVLVFLQHINPLKPFESSMALYDIIEENVVWEKKNDMFKNYAPKTFVVNEDVDFLLLQGNIKPEQSCKTDILHLELQSGRVSCPPLFKELGPLYHPELIQLSENNTQFLLINSEKDNLFFASLNEKFAN